MRGRAKPNPKKMKKEIVDVDKKGGVFQVTTVDERWYAFPSKNKETGLPEYRFVPSVTWIAGYYPKGIGFYKWLADKGWDEAQAIKAAAGDKGSKVHQAIEFLVGGGIVKPDSTFDNHDTGQKEELTVEEYEAVLSFSDWWTQLETPEILLTERTVISQQNNYAGTLDLVLKVGEEIWIVDFKTSQSIWPEYEIQISSYLHALIEEYEKNSKGLPTMNLNDAKLKIVQLGYRRNKRGWKENDVEDKFDLFLTAHKIWANENEGVEPKQKDYPLEIKLEAKKEEKNANKSKTTSARKGRVRTSA